MRRKFHAALCAITLLSSTTVFAESSDIESLARSVSELKKMVGALQTNLIKQQNRITALEAENVSLKETVANGSKSDSSFVIPPAASVGGRGGAPYIPEIGAVADIVGTSSQSKEDTEGNDRLSVRSMEVNLGHDVDPYSRLDATIAFSDSEAPDLEEAYVSFWDLPFDTKAKFGRFRKPIGKAASGHRDSLDTVDEPLIVQRYLGAEGLSNTGAELSGFSPLSGDMFTQKWNFGFMEGGNGDGGELFGDSRKIPSLYARLSNSIDFGDETNAELAATWLNGSNDEDDSREVNAVGIDATLVHYITPRNRLKIQGEALITDPGVRLASASGTESQLFFLDEDRPWGYYTLVDYHFAERWSGGVRWDWVQPISSESEFVRSDETALSGYLTFFQSEFARWRLQYQHAQLIDDSDDNRVLIQGTFAVGTHKHQLQ